jgi:hypothetical protein
MWLNILLKGDQRIYVKPSDAQETGIDKYLEILAINTHTNDFDAHEDT